MSLSQREFEGERTYEDGKNYADDEKLWIKFDVRAVKHEFESNKQGRDIFYDQEYIEIIVPGTREVSKFPMDDNYKRRFRKQYENWKSNQEGDQSISGTVLSEVTWLSKSQVAELNYANIKTVEQLADLSDANAMKFMGSQQLRQKAKLFLEAAAGQAPALRLQQELDQRDNKIASMQEQIDSMVKMIEDLKKKR